MARRPRLLALALLVTGCASTPDIRSDFDPAADFSRYRTYSWIYTAPPQGMNPLMYERVRNSIDRSLAARSFTQASPGDFAVAFTLGARDKVEVTDLGPYGAFYPRWGTRFGGFWSPVYSPTEIRNVTEGSLAIDIYDVATKRPVWHGVATQEITPGKVDQAMIDAAVSAVLAKFPPSTAAK